MNKILVFIPTYNERGNVKPLYQELKKAFSGIDILFCDDNSPDGTGDIIDELIKTDHCLKVMHRPGKMGLGTATIAGFKFAREHGYEYLITMDADFTHHPSYVPNLIAQKDKADIVIGSRYISGGKMQGWNAIRLPLTYFWRSMIKYGLGMPYDSTGAFRLYKVSILKPEIYNKLTSQGFSFGLEALYRFKQNGAGITEIPILAQQRTEGKSKLTVKIMSEFAKKYLSLVAERLFSFHKKTSS